MTVTIFINGVAAEQCSKTLGSRGQVRDFANVTRTNGQFSVTCVP